MAVREGEAPSPRLGAASFPRTPAAGMGRRVGRVLLGDGGIGRTAGLAVLILILGFLSLYPMAMLFYGSIHSAPPGMAGEYNLAGYASLFTAENIVVVANPVTSLKVFAAVQAYSCRVSVRT